MKWLGLCRLIMDINFFQSVSEDLLNKCEGISSDATDPKRNYLENEDTGGKSNLSWKSLEMAFTRWVTEMWPTAKEMRQLDA